MGVNTIYRGGLKCTKFILYCIKSLNFGALFGYHGEYPNPMFIPRPCARGKVISRVVMDTKSPNLEI